MKQPDKSWDLLPTVTPLLTVYSNSSPNGSSPNSSNSSENGVHHNSTVNSPYNPSCYQHISTLHLKGLWFISAQAELLTGSPVATVEDARRASGELLGRGCGAVLLTMGAQGCVVLEAKGAATHHVPAPAVTAVDTTVRTGGLVSPLRPSMRGSRFKV